MLSDRRRLRTLIETIDLRLHRGQPTDRSIAKLREEIAASIERVKARRAAMPRLVYPSDLPIVQRKDEIAKAIAEHQVVVVCGETGSGKTTQLPKICLELGRGASGLIGHTQPRRIAARSVAARVAEELSTPLGHLVGYKVRFGDKTTPETCIKVMTDGILLAEVQGDPLLEQYDTLIIDEAHERSLNIDFLLGIIRRVLPRRPDLKLIITSATIDPERFAKHFGEERDEGTEALRHEGGEKTRHEGTEALGHEGEGVRDSSVAARTRLIGGVPIVEVSGRTYPVEVRYRPMLAATPDEDEPDLEESVLKAVDELARIGPGDILVFLAGEREIREIAEALRKHHPPATEIVPLYARLSAAEQQRVFEPHKGKRIVLATNVAETSLTVPGIRYVVDPGTARLSRYSTRTKVQRLPIEPVSQAAADQRKGRCGRVGPGVCIRLYSEEDFLDRPRFTEPEVLRTNLANVILQMKSMKLGEVVDFPFVDAPESRLIRDGYDTLHELGAVDERGDLTVLGIELAKLPVDPRIGRMLLAASKEHCMAEVLVIAAALSVQDPRERPLDKQDAADEAHKRFITIPPGKDGRLGDPRDASDFITLLNLWRAYQAVSEHLSHSKLRKWCHEQFLSFVRMREWRDIHMQLHALVAEMGMMGGEEARREAGKATASRAAGSPAPRQPQQAGRGAGDTNRRRVRAVHDPAKRAEEDSVHRALLTGLLSNIGSKADGKDAGPGEYNGARQTRFFIFPGSALHRQNPKWVMAAEIVQTTRVYARTVSKVHPWWIEEIGGHLVDRSYSDPHWNADRARVDAFEKVTLFGLEIVPRRTTHYGPVDPGGSRDLFIHHALVLGEYFSKAPFCVHNAELVVQVKGLEAKARVNHLLASVEKRYEFFNQRVLAGVYSGETFEAWRREAERRDPRVLFMSFADVMDESMAERITPEMYPGAIALSVRGDAAGRAALAYRYEPGHADDGVTATVPVEALNEISDVRAEWVVPGMLREKVTELIRGLPKEYRVRFVPAPEFAERAVPLLGPPDVRLTEALGQTLADLTGVEVPADAWREGDLPEYLKLNFAVVDSTGKRIASGRDLPRLKQQLRTRLREALAEIRDPRFNRSGIRSWDFGTLPEHAEAVSRGLKITGYPAIVDAAAREWGGSGVPLPVAGEEKRGSGAHGFTPRGSVSLRLLDSAESARRATRGGLRRLYAMQMEKELAFTLKTLPGYQRLVMQFASLGNAEQLRAEFSDFVVERAFMKSDEPVRNEKEFRARLDPGWSNLARAAQECTELVTEILSVYQPAAALIGFRREGVQTTRKGAGDVSIPDQWAHVAEDIRGQLSRLMRLGFLVDTPGEWLVHYPRFLSAIRLRWQKLQTHGVPRDAKAMSELEPLQRAWESRVEDAMELGMNVEGELDAIGWMIEELRVSLFAQELRTSIPVSVKRVTERLAKPPPHKA